jgi:hypothetical protein
MVYRTIEGILRPDGTVTLPSGEMPTQPVRVMVTILEEDADATLLQPGDYLEQLSDYEDRLARGDIKWR